MDGEEFLVPAPAVPMVCWYQGDCEEKIQRQSDEVSEDISFTPLDLSQKAEKP